MATSQYFAPTHVYFGRGAEEEVGEVLKKDGAKKVFLHFGGGSVVRSGLLSRVEKSLSSCGLSYVECGGVQPNPRLSLVRKGLDLYRKEGCDFILAVGGGSAIDSAKAIAYGAAYNGDVWDFYSGNAKPSSIAPLAVVLTLSATGSEMSDSSVITNDEVTPNDKVGCNSDLGRPRFAFMNPALTCSVSAFQTGSGSADIMMHTLERFFHSGECFEFTDENAVTLLKSVWKNTLKALKNPDDYDARAAIMWAGSVSHNGFTAAGNSTGGDWSCHKMEHEVSALYDVAHGAGLTAIWGSWARHVAHVDYGRFAYLGKSLFGIKCSSEVEACEKTIEAFEDVFKSFGMPIGLHGLGLNLSDSDIDKLAAKTSWNGQRTLGDFMVLEHEDMKAIFAEANRK
ncbi:MAG: iron-containing alcohol dehydrogenase [Sphaerochaetaceae bacterium]|nr:iron-containing alcohol dehydrogenase [Sphaerochaetaceae bacterium]